MGAVVLVFCVVMLRCLSPCLASDDWSLHPQNQTVEEGSSVSFTCRTNVNVLCPDDPIYWMYKSKPSISETIQFSFCNSLESGVPTHASVSWESNLHEYRLNISNVTSSDEGKYFCRLFIGRIRDSNEALLTVNMHAPATPPSPTCQPQNSVYPQCSFLPIDPKEDEHLSLSCRQPEGGQTTLTWISNNKTLVPNGRQSSTQGNVHNMTYGLRKADNCERFTCHAEGNCGVSQCEVVPFKLPVSISPPVMNVVESVGHVFFNCDTDAISSTYKWFVRSNSSDKPPQAVAETDQFKVSEGGKSLRVSALSAADNGTEVKCEVEYEPNCSQSSPWSVLLISTQGDPGTLSSAISQSIAAHSLWLIVWCFMVTGVCLNATVTPHV